MKVNTIPVLYLFENVFYPDTIIPLVLSDEASKKLIQEVYDKDQLFALYTTHPSARKIATIAKVIMIENIDDGKVSAVVQGIEKIHLTHLTQHLPYPIYEFQPFIDSKETNSLKDGTLERLFSIFEFWICKNVKNINEREVFLQNINTPKKLVSNIALFMIKDTELKLLILENSSLFDRIRLIDFLLTGEKPESEDKLMAEAVKQFDRFEFDAEKYVAN